MKLHGMSFLLGVGVAVAVMSSRTRLRPVVVEIGAVGTHSLRVLRGVAERQREHAEDLWAEVEERVRGRQRQEARA